MSSNESSPGGLADTLRFPFLPPTHVITKHATLVTVSDTIETNAPSINVPTVLAGPWATTPTAVLFVAAPLNPLPVPPPPTPDDHLVLPVAPPSLLPRLAALTRLIPGPGVHGTGTVPPSLARTTLISMKTFPVMELSTALAGATLLGPRADPSRAIFKPSP